MFVAQFQTFFMRLFCNLFHWEIWKFHYLDVLFLIGIWREFKIKDLSEYHIITCKFGITLEGENNYVVFGLWWYQIMHILKKIIKLTWFWLLHWSISPKKGTNLRSFFLKILHPSQTNKFWAGKNIKMFSSTKQACPLKYGWFISIRTAKTGHFLKKWFTPQGMIFFLKKIVKRTHVYLGTLQK